METTAGRVIFNGDLAETDSVSSTRAAGKKQLSDIILALTYQRGRARQGTVETLGSPEGTRFRGSDQGRRFDRNRPT